MRWVALQEGDLITISFKPDVPHTFLVTRARRRNSLAHFTFLHSVDGLTRVHEIVITSIAMFEVIANNLINAVTYGLIFDLSKVSCSVTLTRKGEVIEGFNYV